MRRQITILVGSVGLTALSLAVGGAEVNAAAETSAAARLELCYQGEDGRIVRRRRPGYTRVPCPGTEPAETETIDADETYRRRGIELVRRPTVVPNIREPNPVSVVPRPGPGDYLPRVALPDRWRIVDGLPGYQNRWFDPYNRNTLKADVPVVDGHWFFNFGLIAETLIEIRDVPTPVGGNSTGRPGEIDVFGSADQLVTVENIAFEFVYYKGDTVFQPPEWEFRFTPVVSFNRVKLDEITAVNVDPRDGRTRNDEHVGIQALFVDKHLRNVSDRYDFDSVRIGIQPFSSDFRGFLFQDNQLGVRLFGNRKNNVFQYNLAWFRRVEKDTNSGLNDLGKSLREDDVFVANLYWQDFPVRGFVSQATIIHNRNREDEFYFDENGFIQRPASIGMERPREYDVTYLGLNGDGHFGRLNLTASIYFAFGQTDPDTFAAVESDIESLFFAAEVSMDFDWIRPRISLLYASGDDDPYDDKATGFDAIFENPQFAGGDTSYWIRQAIPLIGGGRVALSGRNSVIPSLRSSKEEGQSNFTHPGILLIGAGVDLDVLPELRVSLNWNYLRFDDTAVLEAARNQAPIDTEIGHDVSVSLTYRPFMSQNIVMRASYARLIAGKGFDDLFPDEDMDYFMFNLVLAF